MSNKAEEKNISSNSTGRKIEQVAEKLIMEELLNAFGISAKNNETDFEK